MTDIHPGFDRALDRFHAGDGGGAERCLRDILAQRPDHAPSLHLLGLIAGRSGRFEEAIEALRAAVEHGTEEQRSASGLLLAAAYRRSGRDGDAEALYHVLQQSGPATAEASFRLALMLRDQRRHAEALPHFRRAAEAGPDHADAHAALATALYAAGQLAAAADSAERALALAPGNRDVAANLAVIRNAQGRFEDAEALCRQAWASDERADLCNTLGIALKGQGRLAAAAGYFEKSLALRPDFPDALYNLATVRKDEGRTDEAIRLFRRLVALAPDLAAARLALCMAHLPPLYRDEAEVARRRQDYATELDALIAHADENGAAWLAGGVGAAQPFYLAYQGGNDRDLQRRYGRLVCKAMADAFPPISLASRPHHGERLRLGIVCGHIRDHSVWRLPTRGWVEGLDPKRFELMAYHTSPLCDEETGRAQGLFERFAQGPLPIGDWRERIAADQPHALLYPEIGMDPVVAQLAAMRLAPVQYASWGHPVTSGYPTIDFYLSSETMEPDDGEAHYTERLVRLSGLSTPIGFPPAVEPSLSRSSLGLPADAILYWCGQSLYKYLPHYDGLIADIAAAVPESRFLFIEFPESEALTQRFRARLRGAFAARGLDSEAQVIILPRMSGGEFRAAMASADIVLDSVGWSGCNSLLDAVSHGLPVVTLAGDTMRARHAAAILAHIGELRTMCSDAAAYVETAIRLGRDAGLRKRIGMAMRGAAGQPADTRSIAALEAHIAASLRSA